MGREGHDNAVGVTV